MTFVIFTETLFLANDSVPLALALRWWGKARKPDGAEGEVGL